MPDKKDKNRPEEKERKKPRYLPAADITGFNPPKILPPPEKYSSSDLGLISNIQGELLSSGVISEDSSTMSEDSEQSLDDLIEILKKANDGARSEKDFNSEFYDEASTRALEEKERALIEDFKNPDAEEILNNSQFDLYE